MSRRRLIPTTFAGSILLIFAFYAVFTEKRGSHVSSSLAEPVEIGFPGGRDCDGRTFEPDASSSSAREPISLNEPEPADGTGALRVSGSVVDPNGSPVGGARIELRLTLGDHATIADATVQTGRDGTYQALLKDWRELPQITRSTLRLSGRASAPLLHEWRWTYADLISAGSNRIRLDLQIEPGAMLTGRVLLADGRPCRGATVTPRSQEQRGAPWRRTDKRGHYMIPIIESGCFEIAAAHYGFGVSDAVIVDLDQGLDVCAPDLVIRPGESIEGVVVYPDGRPAGRLALEAESIRADREPVEEIGLRQGRTETDLDGRFTFAGLVAGEFTITCPVTGAELTCDRDRYATGGKKARLTLRLYRMRVRTLDEVGRGALGAKFCYSYPRSETITWASSRTVTSLDGIEFIELPWLEAPREYTFELASQLTEAVHGKLVIEADRFETPIELVIGKPLEVGYLRLSVRGEGGEVLREVKGRLSPQPFRTGGGHDFQIRSEDGTRRLEAPAGRYRVSVRPGREEVFDYFHGAATVELGAGEERMLTIELLHAGRLRLRVSRPDGFAGRYLSLNELSLTPAEEDAGNYESDRGLPIIGIKWLGSMQEDCMDNSKGDAPWISWPTPSVRPGLYALHVDFDGCHPIDFNVRVRAKAVEEVEIQPILAED